MTLGSAAVSTVTEAAASRAPQPTAVALPTRRDEAWRYAPHDLLGRLAFGPAPTSVSPLPPELLDRIPAVDGPRIVVVDGRVDTLHSDLAALPEDLDVLPLAAAIEVHPDQIAAHFAAETDGEAGSGADGFVHLNKVHGRDGAFIRVGAGLELDQPIHLIGVSTFDREGHATCSGSVVHLAAGSSVTLIETHLGAGNSPGGSNSRMTITLGAGASLDHIILQDIAGEQVQLVRTDVRQEEGSHLRAWAFDLGGRYGRIEYRVTLAGEQARADLSGLSVGRDDQVLDQQITVVHEAGNCVSRQAFRSVLDDRSTGVFNGGIIVGPGADGTDAEQANDSLLVSTRAEANTQPRLEILADDVTCKHGATVGQLDDEALYYLRSRGISAEEARRLLIAGFAQEIIEGVGVEPVRAWVAERMGRDRA